MFRISRFALAAVLALAVASAACGSDDKEPAKGGKAAGSALQQVPSPDKAAPSGSRVFVGHDSASKTGIGLIVFSNSTAAAYV